jgi:hypothetical protein
LGLSFGETSERDGHEMSVRFRSVLMPFADVGRNPHGSASELRREAVEFFTRKLLGQLVDVDDEVHTELPGFEIAVRLDCGHVSDTANCVLLQIAPKPVTTCVASSQLLPKPRDRRYAIVDTPIPDPQSPIPNPRSPIPDPQSLIYAHWY